MEKRFGAFGLLGGVLALLVLIALFYVWPVYRVWQKGQAGKAALKEAEFSRRIKVLEAQAHLDAERLNAQAEVVRAKGVSQSNLIIKESVNEQYIRYLWVKTLDNTNPSKEIIYVPTEANLPITEAGRVVGR